MHKEIKQIYFIKSPVAKVWQALVDPKIIEQWGGGPAKMNNRVDTEFQLWGGDIHGKNIEVIPEKELVQEWYSANWEKPSIVTFELSKENGKTKVILTQKNHPASERKDLASGWKDYYFDPIKELLEQK